MRSRRFQRNAAIVRCGRIDHQAVRRKNVVRSEGVLFAGDCGTSGLAGLRGGVVAMMGRYCWPVVWWRIQSSSPGLVPRSRQPSMPGVCLGGWCAGARYLQ